MSPVWSSQGVVLAAAMAVSGTMILLSLLRSTAASSDENRDSISAVAPPPPSPSPRRRSCLTSVKRDGRMKKKVRFLENLKDTDRKTWSEIECVSNCGIETMDSNCSRNLLVVESSC